MLSSTPLSAALYRVKSHLRQGLARDLADKTGLLGIGRSIYNSLLLRNGMATRRICGEQLRFAVGSTFEITEIDGVFEENEFIARILDSLRPEDVFYDVGANIGIVSLAAAKRTAGRGVRIHAFEPEPHNLARLRQNIALNALDSICVEPFALGRGPGQAELFLADGEFGGGSHALARQQGMNGRSVKIQIDSASNCVRGPQDSPTVMKIDVEGAEMEVLLGAEPIINTRGIRELFIEVHIGRIFTEGFCEKSLQQWLESHRYRLAWSHPRGTEIHQHYIWG